MNRNVFHKDSEQHAEFMQLTFDIGRRARGRTGKNPAVGCVIVKNGKIIATAHTQKNGRPHAEIVALQKAGEQARGATVYVSLEPCWHNHARQNCTDALIKAEVGCVVYGSKDPNPEIRGRSHLLMRKAGIEVVEDFDVEATQKEMPGFFMRMQQKKPWVILKIALSANNKIAIEGQQTIISNSLVNKRVHLLRAEVDAIMIGSGTMRIDDPQLTCRLEGLEDVSPQRYIIDGNLTLQENSFLVKTSHMVPVTIFTRQDSWEQKKIFYTQDVFSKIRFVTIPIQEHKNVLSINSIMAYFSEQKVNTLLIEGGQGMNTLFLQSREVDEVHLIRSESSIEKNGLDVLKNADIDETLSLQQYSCVSQEKIADNIYAIYRK